MRWLPGLPEVLIPLAVLASLLLQTLHGRCFVHCGRCSLWKTTVAVYAAAQPPH